MTQYLSFEDLQRLHPQAVENHNNQIQKIEKSDEFRKRTGVFTASELHKLITPTTCKAATGKTADTYILEKVFERLTGERCKNEFTAAATDWGNEHEPNAIERFETLFSCEVKQKNDDQKFFKVKGFEVGATPDGLAQIGDTWHTVEVKCPFNGGNHLQNLLCGDDVQCFKKNRFEYFVQVQVAMWATETNNAVFISYDPRLRSELQLHTIIVPRDTGFIEILKSVVFDATNKRNEMIERLQKLK